MLTQVGETKVTAADGHRLAIAKRLKFETKSNAASLLTALLQHPAYRDALRTDSAQCATEDVHLEDFEASDPTSTRHAIEAFWADEGRGLPEPGASEPLTQLLRDLDLDHSRTLHFECRRDGFQEFAIINPADRVVTLLVLRIEQ